MVAAASMLRPAVVGCSRGRGRPGAEGEGVWGSELVFTDYVRATYLGRPPVVDVTAFDVKRFASDRLTCELNIV